MACILNSQSRDLKNGGTSSNHCEVIILSMNSLSRLKNQVQSFHKRNRFSWTVRRHIQSRVFFVSGVLHGKSADFRRRDRCISSYVIQITLSSEVCRMLCNVSLAYVTTRPIPYRHITSSVSRWLPFRTPNHVILNMVIPLETTVKSSFFR